MNLYQTSKNFIKKHKQLLTHYNYEANLEKEIQEWFEAIDKIKTIPFINRLRPAAILRIKANLQPKNIEVYEDPLHVDLNKVSCTTSIFYVNTCNGYTYFEDGSKVESVANRLVTFPSQTKHAGTTCSDQVSRVVINFNYRVISFNYN